MFILVSTYKEIKAEVNAKKVKKIAKLIIYKALILNLLFKIKNFLLEK